MVQGEPIPHAEASRQVAKGPAVESSAARPVSTPELNEALRRLQKNIPAQIEFHPGDAEKGDKGKVIIRDPESGEIVGQGTTLEEARADKVIKSGIPRVVQDPKTGADMPNPAFVYAYGAERTGLTPGDYEILTKQGVQDIDSLVKEKGLENARKMAHPDLEATEPTQEKDSVKKILEKIEDGMEKKDLKTYDFLKDVPDDLRNPVNNLLDQLNKASWVILKTPMGFDMPSQTFESRSIFVSDPNIGFNEIPKYSVFESRQKEGQTLFITKHGDHRVVETSTDFGGKPSYYDAFKITIQTDGTVGIDIDPIDYPQVKDLPGFNKDGEFYNLRGKKMTDLPPETQKFLSGLINENVDYINKSHSSKDQETGGDDKVFPTLTETNSSDKKETKESTPKKIGPNQGKRMAMAAHQIYGSEERLRKLNPFIFIDSGDAGGIGIHPELYSDAPLTPEEEAEYEKINKEMNEQKTPEQLVNDLVKKSRRPPPDIISDAIKNKLR